MLKRKQDRVGLHDRETKKLRLSSQISIDASPATQASQPFRLLDLPSELRNRIYKFALTAETHGITAKISVPSRTKVTFHEYHAYKTNPEFNQLQYVCRQLHRETATLELKLNTLVFEQAGYMEPEAGAQFIEFARLCSPSKFTWIKNVELHIKALGMSYKYHLEYFLTPDHFAAYTRVARFCRKHPAVEVKYVLNTFSWQPCYHVEPASRGFINRGIVLNKALRDIDLGYLNPAQAGEMLEEADDLRGSLEVKRWWAPNLRFYPAQEEFEEETFRRGARGVDFGSVEGGVERWIAVAKEWAEKGF